MSNTAILKVIETSTTVFTLLDNGVGHMHIKDDTTMDIPEQMENLEALIQLTNGQRTPFYVTAGKHVIITKDARDNAILIENQSPMYGTAVVVENVAYRLIADFYYKINKPKNPYKVFSTVAAAKDWCLQFVNKNL